MCQAVASARMEPVLRLSKKTCNIPIHDTPLHHSLHSHLATLARAEVPHPLLALPVLSHARCTRARDLAPSLELHGAEDHQSVKVQQEVETQR